jgi:outer membrane receptor protein involved in Fe transport
MKNILCILALLAGAAAAQTFTGQLSGRVLDPAKAGVRDATITLTHLASGATRELKSDELGEFVFTSVTPGRYTVRAEAQGFAAAVGAAEVTVAAPVRIDIAVSVAAVAESVTVAGEGGIAVNRDSAELGTTVDRQRIITLPSASRNAYDFAAIAAGASQTYGPPAFFQRGIGIAVNGQRVVSGNYLLDGGQNMNTFLNSPGQQVPLDSVQEYRLQTNNFSAEFGRASGFIANVVTRSGSNEFHGSLYEYLRNSALAANTPDNNARGQDKPVFTRNQFGFAVGGPVAKNRAFFFTGLEAIRVRSTAPSTFYVPTPQFVAISSPATKEMFRRFPIPASLSSTDVLTRTLCPHGANCSAGGSVTIPAFAATARTGPIDAGAGPPQNRHLGVARFDYRLNDRMQFFARYAADRLDQFGTVTQAYSATLDQPREANSHNVLGNLITTVSPSLVLESRFMFGHVRGPNYPEVPPEGFPGMFMILEDVSLPTSIEALIHPQRYYQFFQSATWNRGRHTLSFGGQYVHVDENSTDTFLRPGFGSFRSAQNLLDGVMATLRIGIDPKGESRPNAQVNPPFAFPKATRNYRTNQYALFVNDSWRVKPRLTLGLGLRYESFGVISTNDDESNFSWGSGNSIYERISSGRFVRTADLEGSLKGRLYKPDRNNFAPRASLAWDLFGDGRTVFRGGAGIFYDLINSQPNIYAYLNPPGFATITLRNVAIPPEFFSNPYAALPPGPVSINSTSARFVDPDLKTAYIASWNASLERQAATGIVAALSYVGSSGNKLYSNDNINRLGSGRFLGRPTQRLNPNVDAVQLRSNRGHSSYHALQVRADSRSLARSGLQFGINYTWSHSIDNVSNVAGFTEDILENGGALSFIDAFNPRLDRGSAGFDIRHRLVTSFVWQVPAGRTGPTAWRYLAGGWGVSGILEYQTGQPFNLTDSSAPNFTTEHARPTYRGGPAPSTTLAPDASRPNTFLYLPINQVYANGQCIVTAAPFGCAPDVNGPFANVLGRNTFRRPGTRNENISFLKSMPIGEGRRLELRAEFYNLFNHPNLVLRSGTQNVAGLSFNQPSGAAVPGVTATRQGSRQIVAAVRFSF